VDFVDAIAALEDQNRLEEIDARFDYVEERIQVIGMAHDKNAVRDRDASRRGHMQNHIGPEGHTT
jgi:hypothetical protein